MTIMTWVTLVGGLALLVLGAEWLVRGASQLAAKIGISPLVIGLTVVAFGTSAPEMAVSVQSTLVGQGDIALGNVVGSNIINILFILGLSAMITPLIVQQQLFRLDVPIMIGISILTYLLALDGVINRFEGVILFTGVITYTVFLIIQSRKENKAVEQEYFHEYSAKADGGWKPWVINLGLVGLGLTLLVVGSDFLVGSAIEIARWLGVSELIIGLTIVAAGTSMPEVATSVTAAIKGERDIAVGNVIGSNIFNILAVLGLSGIVGPAGLIVSQAALNFDIPVMIAIAIACFPVFFTGGQIYRWEGAVFLTYYVIYTAYLILNATSHSSLPIFSTVMIWFVLPITALTLAISLWYEFFVRRRTSKLETA